MEPDQPNPKSGQKTQTGPAGLTVVKVTLPGIFLFFSSATELLAPRALRLNLLIKVQTLNTSLGWAPQQQDD